MACVGVEHIFDLRMRRGDAVEGVERGPVQRIHDGDQLIRLLEMAGQSGDRETGW
jgi:hypothetical protein